jgi:hypothetical protein
VKAPAINDRYNNRTHLEQLVWDMRLADLPRGETRDILNRLFNGEPPFPEDTAEENAIMVNRNDLTGVNLLTQARRQWTQAFLKSGNHFTAVYDSGPKLKRREYGHTVTKHANTVLQSSRKYIEQSRACGGSMLLHGMGPSIWKDRRSVVCRPIPISSVMIPSETEIDFDNLPYIAFFREWTPAQFYRLTHGPRTDPGWNMPLVESQWNYVRDQIQKQPNATAFQYMPERITELYKQDGAMWGSDAVPTIDAWDCYLRADDDKGGWYRRIFLDWGPTEGDLKGKVPPNTRAHRGEGQFLYTSGKRVFAKNISEIVQFQFGDCSAIFPQRYHSIRSLGWMLWGLCDLENRLHCKWTEALFEQMMWFFRVASNNDFIRLKRADFFHFGAIPQGVDWVKAAERFTPNAELVQMGFARFQKLIADNASSFTQDFEMGRGQKEMTATETMARVNSVNALVSGLLTLAYTYEEFKDREHMRRLCIKGNPDPLAQRFMRLCLEDLVPSEMLDPERMIVTRERSIGSGNKTMEMAIVQFLQQMRQNLNPDAQRRIDHISVETATDDAALAEELAPLENTGKISNSTHDAQLATERLMRGLPYQETPEMVIADYVHVWVTDLALMVNGLMQAGGMATQEDIIGFNNMLQTIGKYLQQMSQDEGLAEQVTQYQHALSQLANHIKAFEQRLVQQMKAAQKDGNGQVDAKTIGQIKAQQILAESKAKLGEERSAQRMAQDQVRFELEQKRQDQQHNEELRRTGLEHHYGLLTDLNRALTQQAREPAKTND